MIIAFQIVLVMIYLASIKGSIDLLKKEELTKKGFVTKGESVGICLISMFWPITLLVVLVVNAFKPSLLEG